MPQVLAPKLPRLNLPWPPALQTQPPRPARPARELSSPVLRVQAVGLGETRLSFSAHSGEIVHVSGGSPMTRLRLLAMAAGFDQAGSGRCEILGLDLQQLEPAERRALREAHIARVLCCDQLPNAASVVASVALPLVRQGMPITDALARAALELDALGAGDLAPRHPETLQRHEARLALIARATVTRPRLLVLEQPEEMLSPTAVSAVRLSLWALASTFGSCVLMSTAHQRLIASADRHIDLDRAGLPAQREFRDTGRALRAQ
jgi:putative ABC transport system ATP-binding protein